VKPRFAEQMCRYLREVARPSSQSTQVAQGVNSHAGKGNAMSSSTRDEPQQPKRGAAKGTRDRLKAGLVDAMRQYPDPSEASRVESESRDRTTQEEIQAILRECMRESEGIAKEHDAQARVKATITDPAKIAENVATLVAATGTMQAHALALQSLGHSLQPFLGDVARNARDTERVARLLCVLGFDIVNFRRGIALALNWVKASESVNALMGLPALQPDQSSDE
jgi:hypothetical protein